MGCHDSEMSIRMNQSGLVLCPLSQPVNDVPSARGVAVEFPSLLSDDFDVASSAPHLLHVKIERRSAATSSPNSGLAAWQMVRVQAYIDKNLHRPILVRQLSAVARRSQAHFSRKFKLAVGEPPHAYVMKRRLQKACHLMVVSEASLSEIALNVGFSDQAHLSRIFRQSFGKSPSSWRRERQIPSEPVSTTGVKKIESTARSLASDLSTIGRKQTSRTASSPFRPYRRQCGDRAWDKAER